MGRAWGLIVLGLAIALLAAQAVPVDTSNPPVASDVQAPADVQPILRRACYDCHSNETEWPPYARVAPLSWLVARDVHEGRGELNFSVWGTYSAKKQAKKLKETAEEIAEGEMPPWYYTLLHPEAALGAADAAAVRAWTTVAAGGIAADGSRP
jgi:Haem-binding domain